MDMEKVIRYVNTNRGNGQKESLDRLFQLLERLGNPQKNLSYIHITGTNGKGSTASLFNAVLQEAGLSVGLFTSPHLEIVNERIRLNNDYIADADFIRIVEKMEPAILELEEALGEKFYAFELMTTVAFLYFQEKQPDIVVLEAGIGGRLDSTNVIDTPEVAVITSIGLDHVATLGNSRAAIMNEKVQILKEQGHLIVGPVEESLKEIAEKWAVKVDGKFTFLDKEAIKIEETTTDLQIFSYKSWNHVELPFIGPHQAENAGLVLEAMTVLANKGYPLTKEVIYRGLKQAVWPGRFEKIWEEPLFYIDGAHNLASVTRLVETLEEIFPGKRFVFVVGMMKDKEYSEMLQKVAHLADEFLVITPDIYRGFDVPSVVNDLKNGGFKAQGFEQMEDILSYLKNTLPKDAIVIQFGSLYLVGDVKRVVSLDK